MLNSFIKGSFCIANIITLSEFYPAYHTLNQTYKKRKSNRKICCLENQSICILNNYHIKPSPLPAPSPIMSSPIMSLDSVVGGTGAAEALTVSIELNINTSITGYIYLFHCTASKPSPLCYIFYQKINICQAYEQRLSEFFAKSSAKKKQQKVETFCC